MQGIDIFDMRPLDASRKGMCTVSLPFGRIPRITSFAISALYLCTAREEKIR